MIDAVAPVMDDENGPPDGIKFDAKRASHVLGIHRNKTYEWLARTRSRLVLLYVDQPGAMATEFFRIVQLAEQERQRRR